MNQTIENVALDEGAAVTIVTTHLEEAFNLLHLSMIVKPHYLSTMKIYEDAADIMKCANGDIRRKMLRGYLRLLTAKIA